MSLQFRDANIEDLPRIVEIYNSIIADRMVTADTDPVTTQSRIPWFNAHSSANRPLWMVYDGEKNVGWVSFQWFYGRPAYNGTAEISIYVDEHSRGKGYGEKMLKYAMASCERLGIKTLLGYIFAHNSPSLGLFKKLGFEEWGNFPRIAVLDGTDRDLIIVGKRVNP